MSVKALLTFDALQNSSVCSSDKTIIFYNFKFSDSPSVHNYVILTDLLSSLQSVSNLYPYHPIAQRIRRILHFLSSTHRHITSTWIPSHSHIHGNDSVDKAANEATFVPRVKKHLPIISTDITHYIQHHILYWHSH